MKAYTKSCRCLIIKIKKKNNKDMRLKEDR